METSAASVTLYNGYKMPVVGLGTFTASSEEIGAAIDAALEAGYRHIDTATRYNNEAAIGETLKKWLDSGKLKREELFVVTKLPQFGNRPECVEKYLKRSLEALQLSYVDLYLVHGPIGFLGQDGVPEHQMVVDQNTDHVSTWKAMEVQVDAGRARSIGLTNHYARQVKRIVKAARIRPACLQLELHVYNQKRELAAFCNALDIVVCAYAPLGSPGCTEYFKKMDKALPEMPLPDLLGDPVVAGVAKKHGKTPAQVLIRHIIQRGIVTVPKSTNPTRIKENFQVFDFQLDERDMEKLDALDKKAKGRVFRMKFPKEVLNHPEFPFNEPY